MAGERQLVARGEDPDPGVPTGLGRQDEDGLREPDLERQRLHPLGIEPPRVGEHRELVALQRRVREDVGEDVAEARHAASLESHVGEEPRDQAVEHGGPLETRQVCRVRHALESCVGRRPAIAFAIACRSTTSSSPLTTSVGTPKLGEAPGGRRLESRSGPGNGSAAYASSASSNARRCITPTNERNSGSTSSGPRVGPSTHMRRLSSTAPSTSPASSSSSSRSPKARTSADQLPTSERRGERARARNAAGWASAVSIATGRRATRRRARPTRRRAVEQVDDVVHVRERPLPHGERPNPRRSSVTSRRPSPSGRAIRRPHARVADPRRGAGRRQGRRPRPRGGGCSTAGLSHTTLGVDPLRVVALGPGLVDVAGRHAAQRVTGRGVDQREIEMPDEQGERERT